MVNAKQLIWDQIKDQLYEKLKEEAVKTAVRKMVASSVGQWVLTYFLEDIFDYTALPAMNLALREAGYVIDKIEGNVLIKRLNNAQDQAQYDDAIDAIHRM